MEKLRIEDIIAERGQYVSTSAGVSMFPMLRNRRDTVVIRPVSGRLKKYDVPLYRRKSDGAYVLHRIIEVKDDSYVIRGDNCFNKEYDIEDSQIIGVLSEFYRGSRHIMCDSRGFRIYSHFAVAIHPLQMTFMRIYPRVKRLLKHRY